MKQFESSLLHDKLKEYFGFSSFKGNQEAVIRNVLEGKDTFVLMPTGGGKSLCYQLPAMLMEGVAIVISPLIALMKNQVDAMRTFSAESGIAHFLNSSLNKTAVAQVRADVLAGKTKLLYFAPESLTKEDNVAFLHKIKVSFYAIDEAHCISEWGHDFRPEYRRIRPIINEIGAAPLIALTATATPKVQLDIQKNLGMNDASVFKSSFNRPNLYYEIRPKNDVDRDIENFKRDNRMVDLASGATRNVEESSQFKAEGLSLENQINVPEFIRSYLLDREHAGDLIPAMAAIANSGITEQISAYNEGILRREKLSENSSANNPVMQELDNNLAAVRRSIIASLDSHIRALEIQRNALRSEEEQANRRRRRRCSASPASRKSRRSSTSTCSTSRRRRSSTWPWRRATPASSTWHTAREPPSPPNRR